MRRLFLIFSITILSIAAVTFLASASIATTISIVMGMGLPTSIIYILLAVLVGPTLTEFGITELGAHMFLFYFGMLSMITPPLCFATFAAATVANCGLWEAGWVGVRLGIVAYVIPFIFIFQPELLLIGEPLVIAIAVATAIIGVAFISAGFAGYLFCNLSMSRRVLLILAGLLLIPSLTAGPMFLGLNIAGATLGLIVAVLQRRYAATAVA